MKRVTITAVFDVDEIHEDDVKDMNKTKSFVIEAGGYGFYAGEEYEEDPEKFVSFHAEVTNPPREWKFGDIVTKDDHPEGEFRVVDKEGDSMGGRLLDADWVKDLGPFRLVAIDGKVLD